MQHLVIMLDDTSVSYCGAVNPLKKSNLIPLEVLRKAIVYGMKHNLMIQFVYPEYELPLGYSEVIMSIDHLKITPNNVNGDADVKVVSNLNEIVTTDKNVCVNISFENLLNCKAELTKALTILDRLSLFIGDFDKMPDSDFQKYEQFLSGMIDLIISTYKTGHQVQFNLLTDRIVLDKMNNCGAGVENITVAPNGKFYLCPAFYYDECSGVYNMMNNKNHSSYTSVGSLDTGLIIPNAKLLQLENAPLCRNCDAYHCHRCVWSNMHSTMDINTPSHQQCVMTHIERNASRELLKKFHSIGFFKDREIKQINYLDPFDVREEF